MKSPLGTATINIRVKFDENERRDTQLSNQLFQSRESCCIEDKSVNSIQTK